MTRDEIIRMAIDCQLVTTSNRDGIYMEALDRFAALVAAAEREAIAQSLDKQADLAADEIDRQWAQEMAAAVRARGNI